MREKGKSFSSKESSGCKSHKGRLMQTVHNVAGDSTRKTGCDQNAVYLEENNHTRRGRKTSRSKKNPLNWKVTQDYLGHGTCNVLRSASSSVLSGVDWALGTFGKAYSEINFEHSSSFIPEFLDRPRSFAQAALSSDDEKKCAFVYSEQLGGDALLVTSMGLLHFYKIDHTNGGECQLLQVHPLYDTEREDISARIVDFNNTKATVGLREEEEDEQKIGVDGSTR
eukprot:CAMPEP_0117754206 /NCGR_PEP_ID=MMETSP0947-20121206/12693_1 /TAXON_ID=44440 /ORGANISM="Chattonella subsalsa, Strain CCMP2191" /LENGTH=224 /DNA_ID=CAMNT_0005573255 /DNA_START=845 /DNA_END=1519 /DNA_ORIENTATION=+